MNLQKIIGSRIREFRHKRGLTQEELAHKSDLHTTFIAHIESGKKVCSVKSMQKIASALNVSTDELMRLPERQTKRVSYDHYTEKIISLVREENDASKQLILSVISSILKNR